MKNLFLLFLFVILINQNSFAQKFVALTFDDAPDSFYTDKLLDILKEENVKATFFVLGNKVKEHPEIIERIFNEGHLIGNHSTAHHNFKEYDDTLALLGDTRFVDSLILKITGKKPLYFRPPFGALKDEQIELLNRHGYEIAMWTVSTRDWDVFRTTKEKIIESVKQNIHNNAVILMHSKNCSEDISEYPFRDNTIEALPEIIKYLKRNDYQLVTFDMVNRVGDKTSLEKGIRNREDIIFFGGFDENFNNQTWRNNWGIPWSSRIENTEIIPSSLTNGKALRVEYPQNGVGPAETGTQFPIIFNDMPKPSQGFYEEAYLRYYVKFEDGFDFRKGGKLPGLIGGGDSWSRSGGNQPDGTNGWTLRFMWVDGGKLIVYAYVPKNENGKWGDVKWGQSIDCNFKVEPGKWYCIEQFVNIGTPNKDNGKLKVWIDGVEKVNINDMRFWNVENTNGKIGGIYFSTFHGGNTKDWAPLHNSYAQFDSFVVAKKRVGLIK